jgi:polysaccharide export outer membrane protein
VILPLHDIPRRVYLASALLCASAGNLLAAPAPAQESAKAAAAHETEGAVYTIGVGDILGIHVWKDPDVSRPNVMVRPDGRISLPLVGDVQAAGLVPSALSSIITQKLKDYVTDPQVTVIVEAINSYRIYMLGHVLRSGVYTFQNPTRLVEAIASAGGFDQFADTSHIIVLSSRGGGQTRIEVEFKKIVSGARLEDNIVLHAGDTVIVP